MRTEEGKKRAAESRKAYNRANFKQVATQLNKETYDAFAKIAEERGKTPYALLRKFVDDTIHESRKPASKPVYEMHPVDMELVDKLKHECAFYNPTGNMNPDDMLNHILRRYFELMDEFRPEKTSKHK